MPRDIEFRGLNVDGTEWYVGLLSISQGKQGQPESGYYISNSCGMPWAFRVRPETVGQYAGLKDEGGFGVKVYEGDNISFTIFDCCYNETQHTGFVIEYRGCFWCETEAGISWDLDYILSNDDTAKVIGNIHQNPELLEANNGKE